MDKFEKGVPFDPGFSPYVVSFSDNINAIYGEVNKIKAMHQKKFKFKTFLPTIIKLTDNICAFYLGCILWAAFIKYKFQENPKPILNNSFTDIPQEKLQELDFLHEIRFLKEYLQKLPKDCKYYLNQQMNTSPLYGQIAQCYEKFLTSNNNFVKAFDTNDLVLPVCVEHFEKMSPQELDNVYEKIQNSINARHIETLLETGFFKGV